MNCTSDDDPTAEAPANLLRLGKRHSEDELFQDVLRRPGVRIERIVSHGDTTPPDRPYIQDWDEWVLILAGAAELQLDDIGVRTLRAGDHMLVPAGVPHRVTHTDDPTIWLAIHMGEPLR